MVIHNSRRASRRSGGRVGSLAAPALSLALVVVASGCDPAAVSGGGGEGGPRAAAEQPPVPIAVEPAHKGSIASYYSATATLEVEKEAQVLARVSGLVEKLLVEEGDLVEEDQVLLEIENDEYAFLRDQTRAQLANARARFERLKEISRDLVSVEEYETVKNELETAQAAEELAALTLSYTSVRAPFAGRIVERLVDVGQNLSVGTPLFGVADFEPLLARVHVPSKEFKKLQTQQPVQLVLDSSGESLSGVVKLISPVIDPRTGTIKVTVEVDDARGARPGDFAEVRVVTELHEDTLLVSKEAVFVDKGESVVYIAAGGSAERRVVEVGFFDDESAEILSGVGEGELVVVKGQRSLKHGAKVKILEGQLTSAAAAEQASREPGSS